MNVRSPALDCKGKRLDANVRKCIIYTIQLGDDPCVPPFCFSRS